jgi:hypothetical protein
VTTFLGVGRAQPVSLPDPTPHIAFYTHLSTPSPPQHPLPPLPSSSPLPRPGPGPWRRSADARCCSARRCCVHSHRAHTHKVRRRTGLSQQRARPAFTRLGEGGGKAEESASAHAAARESTHRHQTTTLDRQEGSDGRPLPPEPDAGRPAGGWSAAASCPSAPPTPCCCCRCLLSMPMPQKQATCRGWPRSWPRLQRSRSRGARASCCSELQRCARAPAHPPWPATCCGLDSSPPCQGPIVRSHPPPPLPTSTATTARPPVLAPSRLSFVTRTPAAACQTWLTSTH